MRRRSEVMYTLQKESNCNIEGVCWLDCDRIVVVSDKCKSSKQPVRCRHKDQSIHIFNIPHNQSRGLTISSETVKNFLSKSFKKTDYGMNFGQYLGNRAEANDLPNEVKQAYSFYKENVENADWGSVRVYQTHIDTVPIYAVYTSTDRDDGYLEIYSRSGKEIACGRHDANAINWSDQDTLRSEAEIC